MSLALIALMRVKVILKEVVTSSTPSFEGIHYPIVKLNLLTLVPPFLAKVYTFYFGDFKSTFEKLFLFQALW